MIHFYRTPSILKIYSRYLEWKIGTDKKEIFLTFDDGPIPALTEYVLDQLDEYEAKATFFCVGDNILKYPEIFGKIITRDHDVGNHTFNHLKAWSEESDLYLKNVEKCQRILMENGVETNQPLFRPPYGQITRKTIQAMKYHYRIIMWDVLSYDFSHAHSAEKSLNHAIRLTRPGTIIVFHDNYKAQVKLKYMLPRYLRHFTDHGYKFKKLSAV